jgi:hypothetical protein
MGGAGAGIGTGGRFIGAAIGGPMAGLATKFSTGTFF